MFEHIPDECFMAAVRFLYEKTLANAGIQADVIVYSAGEENGVIINGIKPEKEKVS